MDAAIVTVGNELLYGQTTDTNASWLGRRLAERDVPVVRRFTVGDVEAHIREALGRALEVADLVLISGGLGPTPDDLTKAAVAKHFDLGLVVDEGVRDGLEERFRAAGYEGIPSLSKGQAEVPEGARVLHNPDGTAPGLLIERQGKRVVLLPGVPRELEAITRGDLGALLDGWAGGSTGSRIHHRVVHTTGIFETRLAEKLEARLDEVPNAVKHGISLAYLPDLLGVDLRFTIRGGAARAASDRFDALLAAVEDVLAPWTFEAPSGDLAEAVSAQLRLAGRTLATAESCTGGLVAKRMTDLAGASDVFVGGFVAYANEAKIAQLGVSAGDLEESGAVSEPVARQLAIGAAARLGADAGIGITGVAGPDGGSEEKPVGTVWIGFALDGKAEAVRHHFAGDRDAVRQRAAQAALAGLYRRLLDEDRSRRSAAP